MNTHPVRLLAALVTAVMLGMLSLPTTDNTHAAYAKSIERASAAIPEQQSAAPLLSSTATITLGFRHSCALTSTGGVKCWGHNYYGQLGDGTTTNRWTPVNVNSLDGGVRAISAGSIHTCVLTSEGAVKCWGSNMGGQLGDGTTIARLTPVDVFGLSSGVQAISAGGTHTCVLTSEGAVKCWGHNGFGELGDGTTIARLTPVDVFGLSSGVQAISTGSDHTCALTSVGAVKCWGRSDFGELGDGTTIDRWTPLEVAGLSSGVQAISAGLDHTCALTSAGAVKCWGRNSHGQLGDGTTIDRFTPVDVLGLSSGVQTISVAGLHTCALTMGGGVKCWGWNGAGQLGDGTITDRLIPTDVSTLDSNVKSISSGTEHTCAVTMGGGVKCWGQNFFGELGIGTTTTRMMTAVDVGSLNISITAISSGYGHTCALTSAGAVKCWGYNKYGQLGDGTDISRWTPVDVIGLNSGVQAISAGGYHTCALTTGGAVKCWGRNSSNELGDGTTIERWAPVNVSGLTGGVQAVAAGGSHACVLTESGGVKCWGWNGHGQVGDGTTTNRSAPTDVSSLGSGIQSVASGYDHTCALTLGGGVKCWGDNDFGELGDGTTSRRRIPVDVSGLGSNAQAVTTGHGHTCALTVEGGVKCWGRNNFGQLGDGSTTGRWIPVDVNSLGSSVEAITTGNEHTCALTTEGGMKCWGSNDVGQLGDGTTIDRLTPTDVSGLSSGVQTISTRMTHVCALMSNSSVKCWGNNSSGQLGVNPGWVPMDVIDPSANETVVCLAGSETTDQVNPPFCAPLVLEVPVVYTDTLPSEALHGNTGVNRGKVNSWFDHTYPTYGRSPNSSASFVTTWTGAVYSSDDKKGISYYDGHNGIDFAPLGSTVAEKALPATVVAAAGGVIKSVDDVDRGGCKTLYGCLVTIDHGNGYLTRYAHLEQGSIKVDVGYPVSSMHFLGLMGNTSSDTSMKKHLHFGVYYDKNGDGRWDEYTESVDPFGWVPGLYPSGESDPWEVYSGPRSTFLWKYRMNVQSTIGPNGGTTKSASASVGISVPPGAIDAVLTLEVTEGPVAASSAEFRSTGRSFWLQIQEWLQPSAAQLGARAEPVFSFKQPITFTIGYSESEIRHLDKSRLAIAQWNQIEGQWVALPSHVNIQQGVVVAQTTEPGAFDLQGPLQCADDHLEPNDDAYTASLFKSEVSGSLQRFDISDDEDWYRLPTNPWEVYNFTVTTQASGAQGDLSIFAPDGVTQLAAVSNVQEFSWVAPAGDFYYLRVTPASGSVIGCGATYVLSAISQGPSEQLFMPVVQR